MTQEEAVSHWRKRARSVLKAARILFEKKEPDVYGEVIFHCHLALELALKAKYIQEHGTAAPFTHSLGKLADTLDEMWSESDRTDFDQLTDHAVLSWYGDSRWHSEQSTRENAEKWLEKVEKLLTKLQS
ncbi:MAG: HEPN domain-containing protein [Candidatus Peribacteraceae bacterium]|nr:HEPN domain-containing protein [Candidatus Peribacteraceae bacterium]MBP9850791.1 HEPN domain-containing protein [Candidatus Peribacteraceae bacterium]